MKQNRLQTFFSICKYKNLGYRSVWNKNVSLLSLLTLGYLGFFMHTERKTDIHMLAYAQRKCITCFSIKHMRKCIKIKKQECEVGN